MHKIERIVIAFVFIGLGLLYSGLEATPLIFIIGAIALAALYLLGGFYILSLPKPYSNKKRMTGIFYGILLGLSTAIISGYLVDYFKRQHVEYGLVATGLALAFTYIDDYTDWGSYKQRQNMRMRSLSYLIILFGLYFRWFPLP